MVNVVVVLMVIVGRMGAETCFKYCVFSSNGSGSGNVSGIYVVLMIKVSYIVIVGDHHWGGYSRRAEQNIHNHHKSVRKKTL